MQRKGGIGIGSHLPLLVHRIAGLHQMVHISNQMIIRRRLGLLQQFGILLRILAYPYPLVKSTPALFNFLMISCGLYVYHEII